MEFKEIIKKARKIKEAYAYLNKAEGYKSWGLSEHVQGLVGDVGDLTKLMMASEGFRFSDKNDVEAGMAKELADCLLSVMMIAGELDVDLEKEILKNIKKLEEGISDRKVIRKK